MASGGVTSKGWAALLVCDVCSRHVTGMRRLHVSFYQYDTCPVTSMRRLHALFYQYDTCPVTSTLYSSLLVSLYDQYQHCRVYWSLFSYQSRAASDTSNRLLPVCPLKPYQHGFIYGSSILVCHPLGDWYSSTWCRGVLVTDTDEGTWSDEWHGA
jgi:hypothetical protein